MQKRIKINILSTIGIASVILGFSIIIFTLILINIVTTCDMQSLIFHYGPKAPKEWQVYSQLYDVTKHIGNQRNILLKLLCYVIGTESIALGIIFIVWAKDKKYQMALADSSKKI